MKLTSKYNNFNDKETDAKSKQPLRPKFERVRLRRVPPDDTAVNPAKQKEKKGIKD